MSRSARILLILAAALTAATIWLSQSALGYGDFPQLHDSARAVMTGGDIYGGPPTLQGTANLNPPHVALLMAPLGLLPLTTAAGVMWLIILVAIVLFARAVFRTLPPRPAWIVLAGLLVTSASTVAVSLINIAWPLAAATAWAYAWRRTGHPRRASMAIGCLATVKLFYLVFIPYWIWRRDWEALKWSVIAVCVVLTTGVLVAGREPYLTWIRVLGSGSPLSDDRPLDASWHSVVVRLLGPGVIAQSAWALGAALVIVGTWWALRRSRPGPHDWGLLLTAMLVISPLGWVYYALIPALPAAAALIERRQHIPLKLIAAAFAVPAVLVVLLSERMPGGVASALAASIYAMALTCAWLVLAIGHRVPEPSIVQPVQS